MKSSFTTVTLAVAAHCTFGIVAAALAASTSVAQTYPSKPIRLVLAFPPGGSADVVARLIAPKLSEQLGQPVILDHRGGGRQIIASEIVARATPDGHTLFLQGVTHVINPGLLRKLPYDTLNDFSPVSMVMDSPLVFVAHPGTGLRDIQQLIARARSSPGTLNYGSSGPGTGGQLAVELLKFMSKIDLTQVPYRGAGPALVALLGGQVHLICTSPLGALPHIQSGKLQALAVTSQSRSHTLPAVPTVTESGVAGYHATVWYALFGPARMPSAIIDRLHAETVRAVRSADVTQRLHALGADPVGNRPGELAKFLGAEIERWTTLIRQANISAD
jgi:tripartite-type tricarboxylate transporter receptor subunit TctC